MIITKVVPREDFKVFVYYQNGSIKLYDASSLLESYPILKEINFFMERCTIINDTLAWDVSGTMDDTLCIDIAPEALEESISVFEDDNFN